MFKCLALSELFYEEQYEPQYSSYEGAAWYGRVDFVTLRTGLPPVDELTVWLANTVVKLNVTGSGGVMLHQKIWRSPKMWGLIPTYDWIIETWFYFPQSMRLVDPATVTAILTLIGNAVLLIGIYFVIQAAKEVIWGPEGQQSVIPYAILIAAIGFTVTPIILSLFGKGRGGR